MYNKNKYFYYSPNMKKQINLKQVQNQIFKNNEVAQIENNLIHKNPQSQNVESMKEEIISNSDQDEQNIIASQRDNTEKQQMKIDERWYILKDTYTTQKKQTRYVFRCKRFCSVSLTFDSQFNKTNFIKQINHKCGIIDYEEKEWGGWCQIQEPKIFKKIFKKFFQKINLTKEQFFFSRLTQVQQIIQELTQKQIRSDNNIIDTQNFIIDHYCLNG